MKSEWSRRGLIQHVNRGKDMTFDNDSAIDTILRFQASKFPRSPPIYEAWWSPNCWSSYLKWNVHLKCCKLRIFVQLWRSRCEGGRHRLSVHSGKSGGIDWKARGCSNHLDNDARGTGVSARSERSKRSWIDVLSLPTVPSSLHWLACVHTT